MKAYISSVALAALVGLVNAKAEITNSNFDGITAGSTFDITWDNAQGPVTLTLKTGDSANLDTVDTITSGATGNSFEWMVDPSLPSGNYAIEIDDGTDPNFSAMFSVAGTDEPAPSAASASASSSAVPTITSSNSSTSASASASSTSASASSTSASPSSESTSSESSTSHSSSATPTSSESSSSTSSTVTFTSTAAASFFTRPTPTTASPTTSSPAANTKVPNTNDARSMAAPFVPAVLAVLGAAFL
ncbi:Ser-Thr-rich glycosyl-phosphatidyl-inositol-anchored membrane family-domain-containing protein [Xylaria sp. CBS 124048]|nr:Ser-Thr-rich glycosyl-phosphatidyl-inositol-anchored membrane family-domain-containing protein [Xylaria sp. CBS 124048]